jgi:hypothetical protein
MPHMVFEHRGCDDCSKFAPRHGWRVLPKASALHYIVVTLPSKVYCVRDKIILCANNAEAVGNFDPIVGVGLLTPHLVYGIEGIGNCFVTRCFFGFLLDRGYHLALPAMIQSNCNGGSSV